VVLIESDDNHRRGGEHVYSPCLALQAAMFVTGLSREML
jgi:hypothetical protein